jgi:hypothetical protein
LVLSFFIAGSLIITPSITTAQNTQDWEVDSLAGTYQIQLIHTRQQPGYNSDLGRRVSEDRWGSGAGYKRLSDKMQIKILSQQMIDSPDFEPIKEELTRVEK